MCRVIGVVGGDRQRVQPGDRGVSLAERRLDFGQMALRRSVGGHAALRGAEPTAPAPEIPLLEPHLGALKMELRQRNRRDTPVAIPTLVEEVLRRGHIPALSAERGQRRERGEIRSTFHGLLHEREGLIVASDRLEDCGAFGIHDGGICAEPPAS